jgi:hypothetical protein
MEGDATTDNAMTVDRVAASVEVRAGVRAVPVVRAVEADSVVARAEIAVPEAIVLPQVRPRGHPGQVRLPAVHPPRA